MFSSGSWATVWATEDKGNFTQVELSTSRKRKDTDEYETDFSSKFVRFIGTAHQEAEKLKRGDRIKLANCGVTTSYDKENKRSYTNFLVFAIELPEEDGTAAPKKTAATAKPAAKSASAAKKKAAPAASEDEDEDDLPV